MFGDDFVTGIIQSYFDASEPCEGDGFVIQRSCGTEEVNGGVPALAEELGIGEPAAHLEVPRESTHLAFRLHCEFSVLILRERIAGLCEDSAQVIAYVKQAPCGVPLEAERDQTVPAELTNGGEAIKRPIE